MKWLLRFIILIISPTVFGQKFVHWNQDSITATKLILCYENDFFTWNDRYYSQGIAGGFKQRKKRLPIGFPLRNAQHLIGFTTEHQVFTPSTILYDSLLLNNRPYATLIRTSALFESIDPARNLHLGWSVGFGFIGPQAQGREMQTAIHNATHNPKPKGWQYQLPASVLVDLGFYAQERLLLIRRNFSIDLAQNVSLGTTNVDALLSALVNCSAHFKGSSITLYANPGVRFVAYDATLQGAPYGKKGPVTISAKDMNHVISEQEIGIRVRANRWQFGHFYRFQSHLFELAKPHSWGGLRLEYLFG